MKVLISAFALALTMCMGVSSDAKEVNSKGVLLWPSGAPFAKGKEEKDTPKIDIYIPEKKQSQTAIVILPGGGYGGLALDHEGSQIAKWFNSFGVSAFVVHYRLGSNGYHHPVNLMDAQRALRWVRDHSEEYGINPKRVGVIGFSAGGHLASMVGTLFDEGNPKSEDPIDRISSRPDFLVLGYPVISMESQTTHQGSRKNLLGPDQANDAKAKELSSQYNVKPNTPPTFIFQTDEDTVVPAENAVSFYLALREKKIPSEFHIYQDGPHGVGLMLSDPVLSTWSKHLRAWLQNHGWLADAERTSVKGEVKVNGVPVAWGGVVFYPENPLAPVVNARVMKGRFSLDQVRGPATGKGTVKINVSTDGVPEVDPTNFPAGFAEITAQEGEKQAQMSYNLEPKSNEISFDLSLK